VHEKYKVDKSKRKIVDRLTLLTMPLSELGVKFTYLFGFFAESHAGPMSDIDIAI